MSRSRQVLLVAALCGAAVVLASCGFSAAGGIVAGGAMLVALIVGALSLGSMSTGCTCRPCLSVRPVVCLSPAPHADQGSVQPRLQPPADVLPRPVGPCLSPPTRVGPCLTRAKIHPCLSRPPTRVGPCLSDVPHPPPPKVAPCLKMRACLSIRRPSNDAQSRLEAPDASRLEVIDSLRAAGVISEEQAARIKRLPG